MDLMKAILCAKGEAVDLEEAQRCFDFAWEHTTYRANLVGLRSALCLQKKIHLPVDDDMPKIMDELETLRTV